MPFGVKAMRSTNSEMLAGGLVVSVLLSVTVGPVGVEICRASDFATEVVGYAEGTGIEIDWLDGKPFNDPNGALGRPTIDTTGDGWDIPVGDSVPLVHVYPAFRSYEVVAVGNGGQLTVKFDHAVENDPANPYGVDLVVFGNASQTIGGGQPWLNGNPGGTTAGPGILREPGIVSVSQDGQTWYTFSDGPYADDFAPTLGRVYVDDPNHADPNLGAWNDWWGGSTDPTRPLDPNDPNLSAAGFNGKTVAQMAVAYDGSAGGTGFDIGALGLDWIQYVRVDDDPCSSATTEIDALADVARGYTLTAKASRGYGHVELAPDPVADGPPPAYLPGTDVTLTAVPNGSKSFKYWKVYDPNYPSDANYIVLDSNNPIAIVMNADRKVVAVFKCGGGLEPMFPLVILAAAGGARLCRVRRNGVWS